MPVSDDPRTLRELLTDLADQCSKLIRNEVAIAGTELTAKASDAATGVGFLIGGALLLIPGLVLLLMALASWLSDLGLSDPLANLVAGVVGLLMAGTLAFVGKSKLDPKKLRPDRTIKEIERDAAAVKGTGVR